MQYLGSTKGALHSVRAVVAKRMSVKEIFAGVCRPLGILLFLSLSFLLSSSLVVVVVVVDAAERVEEYCLLVSSSSSLVIFTLNCGGFSPQDPMQAQAVKM